jgi:hypothetical protein
MGNQINIEDFESMCFDDGVSKEEKEKIVKTYEAALTVESKPAESQSTGNGNQSQVEAVV